MIILITKNKISCNKCAGFGVFNGLHNLDTCDICHSFHPESLGMKYLKQIDNYHFYELNSFMDYMEIIGQKFIKIFQTKKGE